MPTFDLDLKTAQSTVSVSLCFAFQDKIISRISANLLCDSVAFKAKPNAAQATTIMSPWIFVVVVSQSSAKMRGNYVSSLLWLTAFDFNEKTRMYEIQTERRISNTSAKFAKSIQVAPACPWSIKTDWEQNCLFQQEKSQVFVFIWMSTKLRGGDYHYCTGGGGRVKTARESNVCMCKRDIKRALPGDLKVPMFPHFWEFVIYSCWSHIKQDQRLLPDIFWTYWGNSNDYQRILPTNDDIETILRESEYKKK